MPPRQSESRLLASLQFWKGVADWSFFRVNPPKHSNTKWKNWQVLILETPKKQMCNTTWSLWKFRFLKSSVRKKTFILVLSTESLQQYSVARKVLFLLSHVSTMIVFQAIFDLRIPSDSMPLQVTQILSLYFHALISHHSFCLRTLQLAQCTL